MLGPLILKAFDQFATRTVISIKQVKVLLIDCCPFWISIWSSIRARENKTASEFKPIPASICLGGAIFVSQMLNTDSSSCCALYGTTVKIEIQMQHRLPILIDLLAEGHHDSYTSES